MNNLITEVAAYGFVLNEHSGLDNVIHMTTDLVPDRQAALVQYNNALVLMRVYDPKDPEDSLLEESVMASTSDFFKETGTLLKVWKVGVLTFGGPLDTVLELDGKAVASRTSTGDIQFNKDFALVRAVLH
jgi:hypothetical protein